MFIVTVCPPGVSVTGAAPRPAWYGGPAGTSGRLHRPITENKDIVTLISLICFSTCHVTVCFVIAPPPYRAYTTLRVPSQLGAQLTEKRGSADSLVEAVWKHWLIISIDWWPITWLYSLIPDSAPFRSWSQRVSVCTRGIRSLWRLRSGRLPMRVTWQWTRWSRPPTTCWGRGATVSSATRRQTPPHSTATRSRSGRVATRTSWRTRWVVSHRSDRSTPPSNQGREVIGRTFGQSEESMESWRLWKEWWRTFVDWANKIQRSSRTCWMGRLKAVRSKKEAGQKHKRLKNRRRRR